MADHAKNLDTASGIIFFLGILSSKLAYIPIAMVSGIGYLLSLCFYLLGYLLWVFASHFYPEHPRLKNHWSGFVQFKEQSKVSACVGGIAVIFAFLTFLFPWAIVPSIWLFFISNLIWSVSHYHKLKNPHPEENIFSKENQSTFLKYTVVNTVISLITAVCLTVSFFYPPVAPILLIISTGFGLALTIASMSYFLHYHVSINMATRKEGKNYLQISRDLSKDLSPRAAARAGLVNADIAIDIDKNKGKVEDDEYSLGDPTLGLKRSSEKYSYSLSSCLPCTKSQVEPLSKVDNPEPESYTPSPI